MEVVVPFGKGNKETHGYVIGFSEKADYDLAKIKEVLCIEENHQEIESKLIALASIDSRILWWNYDPGIEDGTSY